ncbi:hypothetical protein JI435_402060 [Parastagonospora nodorum SN15]|uniref:Uncharacterized protein n=1 Tax=Phaeosphaeria nodorum (strain SN15 / ATCC MYA-4574 / FGSC 10173) TaxID=321614 RepID=A0A7U2ESB7_PHANO|nr:hypothetical protein JI435_402060 [Parastagonospora nodorum SN15]
MKIVKLGMGDTEQGCVTTPEANQHLPPSILP